jgi:hypothetical protein
MSEDGGLMPDLLEGDNSQIILYFTGDLFAFVPLM